MDLLFAAELVLGFKKHQNIFEKNAFFPQKNLKFYKGIKAILGAFCFKQNAFVAWFEHIWGLFLLKMSEMSTRP